MDVVPPRLPPVLSDQEARRLGERERAELARLELGREKAARAAHALLPSRRKKFLLASPLALVLGVLLGIKLSTPRPTSWDPTPSERLAFDGINGRARVLDEGIAQVTTDPRGQAILRQVIGQALALHQASQEFLDHARDDRGVRAGAPFFWNGSQWTSVAAPVSGSVSAPVSSASR